MSAGRTIARIPGVWPGILFFALAAAAPAAGGGLAEELAAEGNWAAAETECARQRAAGGASDGERLAEGLSRVRTGERERGTALLEELAADAGAETDVRCRAALEAGYARWTAGDEAGGARDFRFAFENARDVPLFHEAGSALWRALRKRDDLRREMEASWEHVLLCQGAWTPVSRVRSRNRMAADREGWLRRAGRWPGRALVGFYRGQVSPAIGARCSLDPSCSAYFLEATRRHGLGGIPMGADRLIREPDVVKAAERWVERADGSRRIADPVDDHDGWWREDGR